MRCRAAGDAFMPHSALTRVLYDAFKPGSQVAVVLALSAAAAHRKTTLHALNFGGNATPKAAHGRLASRHITRDSPSSSSSGGDDGDGDTLEAWPLTLSGDTSECHAGNTQCRQSASPAQLTTCPARAPRATEHMLLPGALNDCPDLPDTHAQLQRAQLESKLAVELMHRHASTSPTDANPAPPDTPRTPRKLGVRVSRLRVPRWFSAVRH